MVLFCFVCMFLCKSRDAFVLKSVIFYFLSFTLVLQGIFVSLSATAELCLWNSSSVISSFFSYSTAGFVISSVVIVEVWREILILVAAVQVWHSVKFQVTLCCKERLWLWTGTIHPVQLDKAWKHSSRYGQISCHNMENRTPASGFQRILPVCFCRGKMKCIWKSLVIQLIKWECGTIFCAQKPNNIQIDFDKVY